jgi:hypothetical protein
MCNTVEKVVDYANCLLAWLQLRSCREFWRGKLSKGRTSPRSTVNAGSPRNPDRRAPAVVNFKDLNLSVDDELSEDAQVCRAGSCSLSGALLLSRDCSSCTITAALPQQQ